MTDFPEMPGFLDRRVGKSPTLAAPYGQFAKPLIFTFTMLNTYLICPHQMYRRYVKKDLQFVETPEMKWGNEVHTAMEHRMGGKPLPEKMRHWESIAAPIAARKPVTEQQLAITINGKPTNYWGKDVFFRGKNDITLVNAKANAALLFDWKTGKVREDPFELATNAMLVQAHKPNLETIQGRFVWLKDSVIGAEHDVSDTRGTWAKVNNLAEEIKDCQATNQWPKKKGPLCAWCNVFDCENNTNPKKP